MRKTFLVAPIALLVAGFGGYFGFKAYVRHEARQQVEILLAEFRANGVEAASGEVDYDFFDGRLFLKDLSLKSPERGWLTLGSLMASGLDRPSPKRIFANRVELRNLAFETPLPLSPGVTMTYRAPSIDIDKAEGPSAFNATGTPGQIAAALVSELTADRIAIPASTALTTFKAAETRIETQIDHGATVAEWLNAGNIKTASVAPSRVKIQAYGAGDTALHAANGSIGQVTVKTLDLMSALVLLDPDKRRAEEEFRTLYGLVRVDGYELSSDDGTRQSWKSMELRDLAIKPAAIPAEDLLALSQRLQQHTAKGETLSDTDNADLLRGIADAYDGLRLGGATFEGLDSAQANGPKITLATLRVGAFENGQVSEIAFEGLSGVEDGDKPVKIERISLGGLRPGSMLRMAADSVDDPDATGDMAFLARAFGLFNSFELLNAKVTVAPGKDPATIDKLAFSWTAADGGLPTKLNATLRAAGPTDAFGPGETVSEILPDNITRASIAFDLATDWNEAEQSVTVSPAYLEISDAFSLTANLVFTDVDGSAFSDEPAAVIAAAFAANVASVEVTLVDFGLYEQKLNEAAQQQGIPAETIRQLFAGFAELLLAQTVSERPELDPAVQALVAFLQKPMGRIALRATPREDALTVLTVMQALQDDPTSLIDHVEVEVIDP